MSNIKELVILNPETVEGIHDSIPYLLPFGAMIATFDDGHVYKSNDGIVWTSTEDNECAKLGEVKCKNT